MSDSRKMGKGMLWVFWCLVLAALAMFFSQLEQNRYTPNQNVSALASSEHNIVELERNAYGHYVSSGQVNGKEVVFLLDTGATKVAVPESIAATLGLKRGAKQQIFTANGIATAYATEIQSLRIGTIELDSVQASITPGMSGEGILLGMSALKHLDFSQSGNILTLKQARE